MTTNSQVLSEDEVSALLDGVEQGQIDLSSARPRLSGQLSEFDSGQLESLDPERYRALEIVQGRVCTDLRRRLGTMLGQKLIVQPAGPGAPHRFAAYVDSIETPACYNVLALEPDEARALLVLDMSLLSAMVDCYFGGSGKALSNERDGLSPMEKRVNELLLDEVMASLIGAWSAVHQFTMRVQSIETESRYATIASPAELVLVTEFNLTLGELEGQLRLVLPEAMLLPLQHRLRAGVIEGQYETDSASPWQQALAQSLNDVPIPLAAELVKTKLSLRQLATLQEGDIVNIPKPGAVSLRIRGKQVGSAGYGDSLGRSAVRLNGPIAQNRN